MEEKGKEDDAGGVSWFISSYALSREQRKIYLEVHGYVGVDYMKERALVVW